MLPGVTRPIFHMGLCTTLSEGFGLKSLNSFHGRISHCHHSHQHWGWVSKPSLPGMKVISSLIRVVPDNELLIISFHLSWPSRSTATSLSRSRDEIVSYIIMVWTVRSSGCSWTLEAYPATNTWTASEMLIYVENDSVPLRTGTCYIRDIFAVFLQDYCALLELLMEMNFTIAVAPPFVHPMTSLPATPTHSVQKYGFLSEPTRQRQVAKYGNLWWHRELRAF